jgi:hypothetical protein
VSQNDEPEAPAEQAEQTEPAKPAHEPKPPTKFELTPYGLLILETSHDSTESYQSGQGNTAIVRSIAPAGQLPPYGGTHGRLTMTARPTILGFRVKAPTWHDLTTSARVEFDFESAAATNPPGAAIGSGTLTSSESSFLTGAAFRMRQCWAKLESPVVDLLVGQTQQLFGWGPIFYPNAANNLGVAGHLFGREFQVKLSHEFKTSAINAEIAAGAFRPPQRDSEIPDGQAGIRLAINPWKGIVNGDKVVPAQIAASGTMRTFRVQGYILPGNPMPPSQDHSYTADGYGGAVDVLLPLIPNADPESPGNALTVIGEYVMGTGISDLYQNLNFGLPGFVLQGSNQTGSPLNLDPGIVHFDPNGNLRAVDVRSFMVNVQYVLPGIDNVSLSGIFSYLDSKNVDSISVALNPGTYSKTFIKQRYIEGDLHIFLTPAFRVSFGYDHVLQTFLDGGQEVNHRFVFKVDYAF